MKKTDLAYIAGIIDGEGSITIHKYCIAKKKNPVYSLEVVLSSTDEWLCKYMQSLFSGSKVYIKEKPKTNQIAVWTWRVYTKRSYSLIKLIYPYLRLKKAQADLAIYFYENKPHTSGVRLTKDVMEWEENQYLEMKNLKRQKLFWDKN